MSKVYLIRHCKAEGQEPEAPLTEEGVEQAAALVRFFENTEVKRIISSPFKRAIDSIQPLAENEKLDIHINQNLSERVLSTGNLPDWLEKLEQSFSDTELVFEGGESASDAEERMSEVVEVESKKEGNTLIVSHGGIMSHFLSKYDAGFGFGGWQRLSNPDVYVFDGEKKTVERVWDE
ncbi:histidine phosphatase family protein [Jeotgalibacillus salarius]|uniref:Histidine phosphatase family protein n=1 Tax=Jeotgalibacillus salarius TaxID=546023 RepID=A0A4Y8LIG2_9BACL|nr:histidine phosphatase family protein [Jeotgalibacillus salarius]TFE02268.1 histidine phosphatase family protein [Jeotgalibacillus salarius]